MHSCGVDDPVILAFGAPRASLLLLLFLLPRARHWPLHDLGRSSAGLVKGQGKWEHHLSYFVPLHGELTSGNTSDLVIYIESSGTH